MTTDNNPSTFQRVFDVGSRFASNCTEGYTLVSGGIESANLYGQQYYGADLVDTKYRVPAAATGAVVYSAVKTSEVRQGIVNTAKKVSGKIANTYKRISGKSNANINSVTTLPLANTTNSVSFNYNAGIGHDTHNTSSNNVPGTYPTLANNRRASVTSNASANSNTSNASSPVPGISGNLYPNQSGTPASTYFDARTGQTPTPSYQYWTCNHCNTNNYLNKSSCTKCPHVRCNDCTCY